MDRRLKRENIVFKREQLTISVNLRFDETTQGVGNLVYLVRSCNRTVPVI